MIYTRYGGKITFIKYIGGGWVRVKRESDGEEREWHVSDFRADDGLNEIYEEIIKVDTDEIRDYNF